MTTGLAATAGRHGRKRAASNLWSSHGSARVLGAWRGNNIHGLRTENDHTLPQAAGPCISKDTEDGMKTGGRKGGGQEGRKGVVRQKGPTRMAYRDDMAPCSTWRWLAPSSGPHFPFLVAQKHGSALRGVTLYFAFFCRPVEMMG